METLLLSGILDQKKGDEAAAPQRQKLVIVDNYDTPAKKEKGGCC